MGEQKNNGHYGPVHEGAGGRSPKPSMDIKGDGGRAPHPRPSHPPKR